MSPASAVLVKAMAFTPPVPANVLPNCSSCFRSQHDRAPDRQVPGIDSAVPAPAVRLNTAERSRLITRHGSFTSNANSFEPERADDRFLLSQKIQRTTIPLASFSATVPPSGLLDGVQLAARRGCRSLPAGEVPERASALRP
jgi:hypothetical protein